MEYSLNSRRPILSIIFAVIALLTAGVTELWAQGDPWNGATVDSIIVSDAKVRDDDHIIGNSAFLYFKEVISPVDAIAKTNNLHIGQHFKAAEPIVKFDDDVIVRQINSLNRELDRANYWIKNVFRHQQSAADLKTASNITQFKEKKDLLNVKISILETTELAGEDIAQQLAYEKRQLQLILDEETEMLENTRYQNSLREHERLSQEVNVTNLEERLISLRKELQRHTIKVGFKGTLVGLNEKLGENSLNINNIRKISTGEFLFTIAQTDQYIAEASIPKSDILRISKSKKASCYIPLIDTHTDCSLFSLERINETSKELYIAKYKLKKFESDFNAGERVDIYLPAPQSTPLIEIPTSALDYQENILGVWVMNENNTPSFRTIKFTADKVYLQYGF